MTDSSQDPAALLAEISRHPGLGRAGMALTHLGVVRETSLSGGLVTSLEVRHDRDKAEAVRREMLARPGIVDVIIHLWDGLLKPGDPIMMAAVLGETREHVFPVMTELIERLKKEAARKQENKA